jgi:hypothetical protein
VDLPALPWKNWMRYEGILVQSTLEKGSLCEIWVDNYLYMMLRRDKDKYILESEGKREVVNVNDSNMYIFHPRRFTKEHTLYQLQVLGNLLNAH